jgi:hypothetical protein
MFGVHFAEPLIQGLIDFFLFYSYPRLLKQTTQADQYVQNWDDAFTYRAVSGPGSVLTSAANYILHNGC